jgi:hypothetical protein
MRWNGRCIRGWPWLVATTLALAACGTDTGSRSAPTAPVTAGSDSTEAPPASTAPTVPATPAATVPTVPPTSTSAAASMTARHPEHAALAATLPDAGSLGWLPPDATTEDDSDLTSRLVAPTCSGALTDVPSRQSSATNRRYVSGQETLASITFYDVETLPDAGTFMSALRAFVACPSPPSTVVTFDVVELAAPAQCDDQFVVRTHQPVSETVDAWCRVANLVAWVRLYPSGDVAAETDSTAPGPIAPTDQQAADTVAATATALQAAWKLAG